MRGSAQCSIQPLYQNAEFTGYVTFAAGLVVGLLVVQILLGAITVWSTRNPYAATAHVIVGAFLLATVFTVTWWTYWSSFVTPRSASLAA